MGKLDGKVALVTGSGRGIGRAIALKLASEGAAIVVNDLDEQPARETRDAIVAAGGRVAICAGSVTDPAFAARFVATALDELGGLDIIVNNAGYTWDGVIQKMTDEQFAAILDVHVTAPFRILRAAAEPIRRLAKAEAEAGREVFRKVVNISSVSGLGGNAGAADDRHRRPRATRRRAASADRGPRDPDDSARPARYGRGSGRWRLPLLRARVELHLGPGRRGRRRHHVLTDYAGIDSCTRGPAVH